MAIWVGGAITLLFLTVSQEWFYEQHRRRYGLWRSTRERRLWADPDERSSMWFALTHCDEDPTVERARRVCLAGIALCIVAGLVLIDLQPYGG